MRFSAIISSVKPFKDDSYTAYQKAAISSWLPLCDSVVLLNRREDIGDVVPVELVEPKSNPPPVKQLLQNIPPGNPAVIVNSDIILSPSILRCLEICEKKNLGRTWAATSFRYEGDPPEIRGQGLDVFVLGQGIIPHILKDIPEFMTLGRGLWDNWMNGWLRRQLRETHYFDMTPWRCVHHPLHEGGAGAAHSNYTEEEVTKIMSSGNLSSAGIPKTTYA